MKKIYTASSVMQKKQSLATKYFLGIPKIIVLILCFFTFGSAGWSQITSTPTGGLWDATTTWVGDIVPSSGDVIIADGATVIINTAPITLANLTVGQGTSGVLTFDGIATVKALTVSGNVTVATGGIFKTQKDFYAIGDVTIASTTISNVSSTSGIVVGMVIIGTGIPAAATVTAFDATTITLSAAATVAGTGVSLSMYTSNTATANTLAIGGDLTNNGTFDMSLGLSTYVCGVTFNKNGDQAISGTGTTTRFRGVTLDKTAVTNKIICSTNSTIGGSSAITYTYGTWEQNANTLTVTSGSQPITANGALVFSGSGSLNMAIAGSIAVTGKLEVNTTGTFIMGSGNNSITTVGTPTLNFLAGNVTIYGRLTLALGTTTISGANISIDPQHTNNLGATSNAFEVSGTANLTFSSGSVTIVDPNAAATSGRDLKLSSTGTVNISGGTIYFGDGVSTSVSTGAFAGFLISTTGIPVNNIVLQTGGIAGRNVGLATNFVIGGTLTLTSGTFDIRTSILTIQNPIAGTETNLLGSATSSLTIAGSASGIIIPGSITALNNLTINNSNGAALAASTTLSGALTLTSGKLFIGANDLTIGSTGSIAAGYDATRYIVTSGIGLLKMNTVGVGSVTYPVGSSFASYTPIVSTDNTSGDVLGTNVKNSITNATLDNEKCVKLEWQGNESVSGGNTGTITFQWNASDEGSSFNRSSNVLFGVWDGTKYYTSAVTVNGTGPYTVTIPAPASYPTYPVIFGNTVAFPVTPVLTAASTNNDVEHNFDITFTDDAAWRAAVTDVKVGGTSLNAADWDKSVAGIITIKPTVGNALLTVSGSKTITVIAPVYADATITQLINPGVLAVAKSTISNAPAMGLGVTSTVTLTVKDQYENLVPNYVFKYDATVTNGNVTTAESYTIATNATTASATDIVLAATDALGVKTFDIIVPGVVDGGDGLSVQLQLNDGTTNLGAAISYSAPLAPTTVITPATIAEHSLEGAVISILIQNTTFVDVTIDKTNFTLNNAPAGLTIASVAYVDATHATLTLAYDDANSDFDADVTTFSVKIALAELASGADLTSNDITLSATTELLPTVTTSAAITTNGETTATWGGNVSADGGETISVKGLCWGLATAPTTADFKTTEAAGIGAITGNMTGLTANTVYFVRAYATNSVNTAYGDEKSFRTYSAEPTNQVTTFAVTPNAADLAITWVNNNGATAPTHYLIKASTADNITDPVDGTVVPADNLVIGANNGVKVCLVSETSFAWTGLTAGTQYFFKIYALTQNTDNIPNYNTTTAPAANATTNSAVKDVTASAIGTLNVAGKKITDIPAATTVTALKAGITVSANAAFDVLASTGGASATGTDAVSNTMVVKITSQNGTSQEYALQLYIASQLFYDGFTGTGTLGGNSATAGGTENGWTTHSGTKVGTIDIQTGSLTYEGLQAATGNMVYIPGDNTNTPRDVNAPVTVTGTVAYYSALINVIDNTQLGTGYDYFMSLGQTAGGSSVTVLPGRLGIKAVTASTTDYQLGILNTSTGTLVYTDWTSTMLFGTTYLVVVKVDLSTSPITVKLWVNPATLGGAEATGSVSNNSGTGTAIEFKSVCIRNGSGPGIGTPKANIDEIRVGTTFAEVTPVASTNQEVTVNKTSLADFGSIIQNTVGGVEASFTVSGLNLTNDIVITAPEGFEISTVSGTGFTAINPINLTPASGTVSSTPIYVKFHPIAVKAYTGNITVTSGGATSKSVAVTGTGIVSDNTAPAFIATYPKSANIGSFSFDLIVNIDEPGKVWFLKLAKDATAPSSADVKSTGTLITAAMDTTEYSKSITSLTMGTSYDVYFVTEDNQSTPNLLASPVMLAVTTLTIPAVTIHDIQYTTDPSGDSPYLAQTITTSGVVTAIKTGTSGTQQAFYIQDGSSQWNGVYIYTSAYVVAIGDSVTVTGTVKEYYKLTEIDPVANVSIVSSGNTVPGPVEISTLAASDEGCESVLVKVKDATCVSIGTVAGTFMVNDASGDLTIYKGLYSTLSLSVSSIYTITGILTDYYSSTTDIHTYEILPRNASDIQSTNAIVGSTVYTVDDVASTITNIPADHNLATFIGNLFAAAGSSLNVFDADGITPATVIDNSKLVIVTTEDGTTKKTYTIVITVYIPSTVASLSKLYVSGTAVNGFMSGTLNYAVLLPVGTSAVPAVTYTLADTKATAVVTNATNLLGTEAERTSKVVVTAEDVTTVKTYTVVFSVYVQSTDATLSSLLVNGTAVAGFAAGALNYAVLLPMGTSAVPVVNYFVADVKAIAVVTNATNLFGTEAERTSKVVVTAEDGTTVKTYTIVFTVDNTGIANNGVAKLSIYPVPAIDEITISGLAKVNRLEIMDVTGKVLRIVEITGEEVTLNISNLRNGMYFLRTESQTLKFIKK